MIIVDTETSGVHFEKHGVLSIGAIEFENQSNTFYTECRLWDKAHINPKSLGINGFTKESCFDQTRESQYIAISSFVHWATTTCTDITLAGHNTYFDYIFLSNMAEREGVAFPFPRRLIDLHSIIYADLVSKRKSLPHKNQHLSIDSKFIQKYCRIKNIPALHNALSDAQWETDAFNYLLK